MSTLAQDKQFLVQAVPELGEYLLSQEIFWPLGGSLPRLTLGSLLLAQARLDSLNDPSLASYYLQVETLHVKWMVAWEQKSVRELHTRLSLWQNFLEEYRTDPDSNLDRFAYEVRNRAMLHLLAKQFREQPRELDSLPALDGKLKGSLTPGSFIWEKEIESSFPQPEYWFLYGTLKSKQPH